MGNNEDSLLKKIHQRIERIDNIVKNYHHHPNKNHASKENRKFGKTNVKELQTGIHI